MARKLYPIGIQTFERIRKEDKFYIDKTEYVYRMTHTDGTYFFLSRPRRFGKSLLVSTFQSYFEGKKELFKGLAIVVGTPLTTEWLWERNQAAKDKRGLDELPYDETDSEEMLLSKKKKHRKITAF